MCLSLAPLQGYTEYPFRNALASFIGGVNCYYSPYLRFENDGSIRSKHIKDILPENNKNVKLIPQILVNNSSDFLKFSQIIEDYGYTEINWNLGCPYPMVAKRNLGSGLLSNPSIIHKILEDVFPKTNLIISIKMRSGYQDESEINQVIEVFNQFPLKEIIYHPRIGKQLYKGEASIYKFAEIQKLSKNSLAYNGDIGSISNCNELRQKFPGVQHYMIGRGLVSNPFLAFEIQNGEPLPEPIKRQKFTIFHAELFNHYKAELSGESHLLNKFIHYWEYFSGLFVDEKRVYKTVKKCKTIALFKYSTDLIMSNNELKQ